MAARFLYKCTPGRRLLASYLKLVRPVYLGLKKAQPTKATTKALRYGVDVARNCGRLAFNIAHKSRQNMRQCGHTHVRLFYWAYCTKARHALM